MISISAGVTDAGRSRSANQDRILFDDHLGLYVVCDGLGGRRRGDVAAELATEAIRWYIESSKDPKEITWPYGYNLALSFGANRLATACRLANRQVWRRSEESLEFLGMGTTISAVLVADGAAVVTNIGDSRVYLFRDSHLEQLSVDDTAAGSHMPTREIAMTDITFPAIRSVLTRAAGSQEDSDVHLKEFALQPGDVLLLCSDGLHGCVSDEQILKVFENRSGVQAASEALLAAAMSAGAPDNVSAVVVRLDG
jgi:serine/threonine protein phosphatase PrpC